MIAPCAGAHATVRCGIASLGVQHRQQQQQSAAARCKQQVALLSRDHQSCRARAGGQGEGGTRRKEETPLALKFRPGEITTETPKVLLVSHRGALVSRLSFWPQRRDGTES